MSAIMLDGPQAPVPAANADDDDTINLLEYWQVLRDRQWVVAGVAAAVFVLALVATLLATPIFRASSTLQIERDTMKIMDVEGLTPAAPDAERARPQARQARWRMHLVHRARLGSLDRDEEMAG